MALVDYSSSDSDEIDSPPPTKKQKSISGSTLPPLPSSFRDLYSSTVRTSTQDDPSLHEGRKRAIPHVAGNWPTHVYLEWCPEKQDHTTLREIVESLRHDSEQNAGRVYSLLENDLGVELPLHVSLSRPLSLRTEQKDRFHIRLKEAIADSRIREFSVQPTTLIWHPNEDGKRWFLVLKLGRTGEDELQTLLEFCNRLAKDFDQPLLYEDQMAPSSISLAADKDVQSSYKFHVSIAWSLQPPGHQNLDSSGGFRQAVPNNLQERISKIHIEFSEAKVRLGQDVLTIALPKRRVQESSSSALPAA